jgi:hypothetical protein
MLLLHMQIRRYFNKICDNFFYSQARDNSLYVIYTSTQSYMIAPSYEMSEWVSFWFEWDLGFSECERVLDFDLVRANGRFERWVSVCVRFSGKLLFLRICWNDSLRVTFTSVQTEKETKTNDYKVRKCIFSTKSNRNASIKSGPLRFPSFPVVDWFCLFVDLWVLPFPLEDCSVFGNFVITLI